MAMLIATIGLPGSGKSRWAREEAARSGALIVSRDELRAMLCPGPWPHGFQAWEDLCTAAQVGLVTGLLRAGRSVIVHDTNLVPEHRKVLERAARAADADYREQDFRHVPVDVCVASDAARPYPLGEHVIRGMWQRYLAPEVETRG